MHERREVHELDCDPGHDGRLAVGWAREIDEQRAQPLAAGGEGFAADLRDDAAVHPDGVVEPVLELGQVRLEPRRLAQLSQGAHLASAVWSATMPPAKVR